ncbi:MAG: DUF2339 domain-containing protein [Breznakibacter sp.]
MELLLLIVLVAAFIWLRSLIVEGFRKQQLYSEWLKRDVDELRDKIEKMQAGPIHQPSPDAKADAVPLAVKDKVVQTMAAAPVPEVTEPEATEVPEKPWRVQPAPSPGVSVPRPKPVPGPAARPKATFFERHPDFEKFVGENLINKIGIAILVLGIGFFVKYAIDQEWINEVGRMAIGILSGGALIGVAHRLRKTFTAFSSVLIGGGLSVLYFSIGIGFHDYHLLSQTAAFAVMVVITAFAVVLSVLYDRKELAVIALVGGFGTPFFVSSGEGSYVVLFSYLLILNVGMTILSVQKKWGLVNVLSYIFTLLIYGGWLGGKAMGDDAPFAGALLFGTLFYLLFFAMNVGYNIKHKHPFRALDISMLVSNSFFYFVAGMVCLSNIHDGMFRGLFTVALGVFNYVFAQLVYRNHQVDRNLFYLLVGLVLTFISLAAPIQLKGNYITLFWAAEGVLLLWLSQKSGIELIKKSSLLVLALMVVSLLMDWSDLYGGNDILKPLANQAFVASMVAVASIGLYRRLASIEKTDFFLTSWAWKNRPVKLVLGIALVLGLYFGLYLELRHQLWTYVDFVSAHRIVLAAYTLLFVGTMFFVHRRHKQTGLSWAFLLVGIVLFLCYLWAFNPSLIVLRNAALDQYGDAAWAFHLHAFVALATIYVVYVAARRAQWLLESANRKPDLVCWLSAAAVVFVLSAELDHVAMWLLYQSPEQSYDLIRQTHKFGYPILWGILSFALMVYGMKRKIRLFRIISLSLFGLIILKLFLVDVWGMSKVGKIAAFVSLGVLLLVVSFLYQKLKGLLADGKGVQNDAD